MTRIADIGWASYKSFEGPFFRGTVPYLLPENPTSNDMLMNVITATEGGRYDAINMYDRCVLTTGIIQWCEGGQFSVSDLIGSIRSATGSVPAPLQTWLDQLHVDFKTNEKGRWRFSFRDSRGEVDTLTEQKRLFLLHSNGLKGSWGTDSRTYAKGWAAAMANTLALPEAHAPQVEFTTARLMGFVLPEARDVLWDSQTIEQLQPTDGWQGAIRAAYMSFAANLPAVANNHLKKALANTTAVKWSPDWCISILKQLTFGPQIAIYPTRYNAIRPVIERLYGVDLPDFAMDLQKWRACMGIDPYNGPGTPPTFMLVVDIQKELLTEGYDLGPAGADGRIGSKTLDAIMTFQGIHGLSVDGIVGPKTRKALVNEWLRRS